MLKSPALLPLIAMLLIVIAELSPFFSVAVCAALDDPTVVLANVSDVGLTETPPPGAYPVSVTVCGEFVAESLKFNAADKFPDSVGAKTTFAVQLAPEARLVPQVFE
jgi:hypothetical protein